MESFTAKDRFVLFFGVTSRLRQRLLPGITLKIPWEDARSLARSLLAHFCKYRKALRTQGDMHAKLIKVYLR